MITLEKRIAIFVSVLIVAVFVLMIRIAWIQFVDGKNMTARANTQLRESKLLHSPRGTIYDRNGQELAVSGMTKSLYANPAEIKDADNIALAFSSILGMKAEDIKEKLLAGGQFIWIKRMIEPAVAKQLQEIIKQYDIKGLGFLEESKRYYPNDTLAAQVLGFVGTDDIGLDGIEMVLDKTIKGKRIEQSVDTDSHGIPIFKSIFNFIPNQDGKNVYLTLDSSIQFIVENSLDKAIKDTGAQGATVIVMNPQTGEILAMANRPTYNPNQFYKYSDNEWKNRAVSYNYEPGSTFKTIVAAAAIQEGKAYPEEIFVDKGYVEVSGRRIKNWNDESYGNISFLDILKYSINTGFVQVGMRLGANKLTEYAQHFGFGKATGIDLPGEEAGLLFEPGDMRDSDTATMAIGQSIAVTPLQLVTAVAAIANDGVLLKPHIIKEIRNADGTLASAMSPQPVRQVISSQTARTIASMMEKEVSEGGGNKAAVKGYHFAGKTGTAEKLKDDGSGYAAGRYVASFIGFGPVENPQVVVLVVLDDPSGVYYGGQIAAPVASDILGKIMRHLNIHPYVKDELVPPTSQQKPQEASVKPQIQVVPPAGKAAVPNVYGMSIREAGEKLNKLGLAMVPVGTGVAVRQNIVENTIVEPGTEITIYFEAR